MFKNWNYKRINYLAYKHRGVISLVGVVLAVIAVMIAYSQTSSSNISIFFAPEKNLTYFGISNLGDKATVEVKYNYTLDCQNRSGILRYIDKPIPNLPPSNNPESEVLASIDNESVEIMSAAIQSRELCSNGSITNFDIDLRTFFSGLNPSFDLVFCEVCRFSISVWSKDENKKKNYTFINPLRLRFETQCPISHYPMSGDSPVCSFKFYSLDGWNSIVKSKDLSILNDPQNPTRMHLSLMDSNPSTIQRDTTSQGLSRGNPFVIRV